MLAMDSDDESLSENSDDIDADAEDVWPRVANEAEQFPDIDIPMDFEPADAAEDSDFFGTFHEHDNADDEIQFDINMDDISLGLDNTPDLEDDSDSEDEEEYIW